MENQKVGWAITAFSDQVRLGKDAEHTAEMIVRSWEAIDGVMRSVIGRGGVDALFLRSVEMTAILYPWLADTTGVGPGPLNLDRLRSVLTKQEMVHFAAAGDALLLHFHHLLVELIGLSLTERLLRPVLDPLLNSTAMKGSNP